jgi:zinc/manganese transport system permease protein
MPFPSFFGNGLLAGTAIAAACGLAGWFVVLRGEVFAGDALSHVAFTGALAAAAVGLDLRLGLFLATLAVALLLGALGGSFARAGGSFARGGSSGAGGATDDATIGVVFAWTLGLGVLCLYLFNTGSGGADGTIAARTLFGSIFGLSAGEARLAALIATLAVLALLAIARPLLFASIDAPLAAAAGVPVRGLGLVFLVLLGVVAAEATQAVGALLLLGLLAAPAGAARRLTANPYRGMVLSVSIALLSLWAGLAMSYWIAALAPGSAAILTAAAFYAVASLL